MASTGVASGKVSQEWQDYLLSTESVLSEYTVGGCKILTTDKRIMLLKGFPKSFIEIKYDELLSIEHYTEIFWDKFLKSIVLAGLAFYIYRMFTTRDLATVVQNIIMTYLPEVEGIVPVDTLIMLAVLVLGAMSLIDLLGFLYSTIGYLKFSRKNRPSIKLHSTFTPTVRNIIKEVENQISGMEEGVPVSLAPPTEKKVQETERRVESSVESIYKQLKTQLSDVKKSSIVLISMESQQHTEAVSSVLKVFVNDMKMGGIYVSVSKPYEQITKAMELAKVRSSNLFFIDCISHMAGKLPDKAENAVFIENPSSLEEISLYIDKLMVRIPEPKFILLDSLSSLLIYNNERSVEEFTHLVINKMRLENVGGIIVSIKQKEAEALTNTLIPMCDREIVL